MAMKADIRVHAQFPKHVSQGIPIDLDASNWEWRHCLTFPVDRIALLSTKPFKWVRYATGIIVGAQGDLSHERDSLALVNYEDVAHPTSIELFYHVSDEEKLNMFPLDQDLMKARTVTSSRATYRRGRFRARVEKRDETCVLTGAPENYCDAAHMIGFSKGDKVCVFSF